MTGSTSSQKKIRDLQRLLARKGESMSEEDKASIQAKINELQSTKTENIQKVIKRKHEQKYHMVKFFERKKVTRCYDHVMKRLQAVEKELEEDSGKEKEKKKALKAEKKELEKLKGELEDDLTYIMYYPVDMKYIALFAGSEREEGEGAEGEEKDDSDDDEEDNGSKKVVQLKKCVLTGKVLQTSEKAREKAREQRAKDIAEGSRDLVQHAIDVQMKVKTDKPSTTGNANTAAAKGKKRSRGDEAAEEGDERETSATSTADANTNNKKAKKEKKEKSTTTGATAAATTESSSSSSSTAKKSEEAAGVDTSGDAFFVEEASPEDLAKEAVSFEPHSKGAYGKEVALVKQAVNQKKYTKHKNQMAKQTGGRGFGGRGGGGRGGGGRGDQGRSYKKF